MKNSIVYLPSDKQADLEVLVKEVLKRLYQTVFIIQYGSYAVQFYENWIKWEIYRNCQIYTCS